MRTFLDALRGQPVGLNSISFTAVCGILLTVAASAAQAQGSAHQPATTPSVVESPAPAGEAASTKNAPTTAGTDSEASTATNPLLRAGAFSVQTVGGDINEDQLKQLLVGKTLYLRGGYLDNGLEFDEWGRLTSRSLRGSFTLNEIQIDKVKLSRHKVELEGNRYALRFPGADPYEDPRSAADKVKITPKKKTLRISFDREKVELPKKKKEKHAEERAVRGQQPKQAAGGTENSFSGLPPSDKVTTTTSPAHASQLLLGALDKVFSYGIDDRMVQSMPDFWKLYFQAVATHDYRPDGAGIYRQNDVDQKARLVSALDPPSNEFAQANEIAGMALYHVVIGSDGKVEKVVVARPIGFGLDENAEQTIEKAVFQPAVKGGKPVPVALDLVVSFRIYSKRTAQPGTQDATGKGHAPVLPGPYTVQEQSQAAQQPQPSRPPQPSQSPQ